MHVRRDEPCRLTISRHIDVRGATSKLPVRVCDRDGSTTSGGTPVFTQISRSQAAHVTTTARTGTPIPANIRTDSEAVAPVVSTSSTSTTSAFSGITAPPQRLRATTIRPRRLRRRSAAVKPTESRTPHHTRNIGTTRQSGSHLAAAWVVCTTGSPPRRRAATLLLGAGINTSGRPSARNSANAVDSAMPSGSARSRRPCSLAESTARRPGPAYFVSAQHGTPGSVRGRTRTGPSVSTAAQSAHQPTPAAPHPAQADGSTRSSSVRITRVCAHPPTSSIDRPRDVNRALPLRWQADLVADSVPAQPLRRYAGWVRSTSGHRLPVALERGRSDNHDDQPGRTGMAFAPRPGTSRQ